ncbi:5-carboxymethyl-2-hydroxymuconate isomerase, partial [Exophiala aquamarina CBS 119918]
VLAPLPRVLIFSCIGLNYKAHAAETKTNPPVYPVLFNKPSSCLAGPADDIPIHKDAQFLDYEGELCIVIGQTCKDLSETDDALDYVLGYTVGNDVSSRYWQMPDRSGQQAGYSKSFDKFAPLGPVICSTAEIPSPETLTLVTKVNGLERQRGSIEDLIFTVQDIVRFTARGHTLEPGTVIMTGTPSGVAAFMKPPAWLKDGDVVEIAIDEIGTISNKMVFE